MAYVAMIGLLFVPLVLLLLCAWNFVKYQSETDENQRKTYKKRGKKLLIIAIAAAILFGILKIAFPF